MASESGHVISAIGLQKRYGRQLALDGVTLNVSAGEVVCIIGPNGVGKTTLLYLLAGVIFPTAGHVRILGLDRWENNFELRKRITVVPADLIIGQSPTPYAYLRLVGQLYGMEKNAFAEKLERMVGEMDFGPHLHRSWCELSFGLAKKAVLIGGFLPEVPLRIMDEPFAGGIDPLGMEVLYHWARAARLRGETVVFSTQVLEQAETTADRLVLLHEGRVSCSGRPVDVIAAAGIDPAEPRALGRAFIKLTRDAGKAGVQR